MQKRYKQQIGLWLGMLALLSGPVVLAQNYVSAEQFGKNRIQYREFEWQIVKTANFEIYYYQNGGQIANLTAQYAESEFDRITELLGYTPYNRIKIFLFNAPQERIQSNIGLNTIGELDNREIDLAKSRIEIAFTGDQVSFRRQLIRDVSMLFIYDMLYGGSLKDALQSSLLLTLPDWFMPGMASYIAEGWSVDLDDYMRDVSLTRPVRKPSLLVGRDAERVGQSIWNYISQKYGRDNISNILNLTRIIRNEQSSIQSTLGIPYNRFLKEWREYYAGMASPFAGTFSANTDDFRLPLPDDAQLGSLKLSSDKQYFAYSVVRDGKFRVEVVNTTTHKRTSVLEGGYRLDGQTTRLHPPLLAWQGENDLVVIANKEGDLYLYIYGDIGKRPKLKQRQPIKGLTQVVSVDAAPDGGTLIMSADRNGQNDLYLFSVGRGTFQQLTNDLYDDLDPHFVGRSARGVVFSSNRTLDTLGVDKGSYRSVRDQFSLFRHEGGVRATSVSRLTDSLSMATQAIPSGENTVFYVGSTTGIRNLYRLDVASGQAQLLTALPISLGIYDLNPANGGFVYSSLRNGQPVIGFRSQLLLTQSAQPVMTPRQTSLGVAMPVKPAPAKPESASTAVVDSAAARPDSAGREALAGVDSKRKLEPGEVDTDNYQFDPEVLKSMENRQRRSTSTVSASQPLPRNRRRESITIRGPYPYKGLFIAADAPSGVRLDPIRGFGFTQSVTMNDLLENHVIKAGLFLTTNLKNSDLFAEYTNLTHRIDYGARVDRQTLYVENGNLSQKYRYNRVAVSASYPLSITSRVTLSPFYALTRLLDLSNLSRPDVVSDYAGLRAEFVYDNTRINGMNMVEGTRFKARFEQFSGLRASSESFNRITVDLRRYQKLHRDLVLALRLSYAQSGGPSPKQSTLGGMENWINNQREGVKSNPLNVPSADIVDDYRNLFFLDVVTNLRGFRLGKVTGNSHLLANAELRLPLVKYLHRGAVTSNFLRNLQLVAFTDIGTAWSGNEGPFSRKNSLNTDTYGTDNLPFYAVVTNFKNPFLVGYGVGARTMLFGYYAKFDYAWGLENKVVNKPIAYLTLGYDF